VFIQPRPKLRKSNLRKLDPPNIQNCDTVRSRLELKRDWSGSSDLARAPAAAASASPSTALPSHCRRRYLFFLIFTARFGPLGPGPGHLARRVFGSSALSAWVIFPFASQLCDQNNGPTTTTPTAASSAGATTAGSFWGLRVLEQYQWVFFFIFLACLLLLQWFSKSHCDRRQWCSAGENGRGVENRQAQLLRGNFKNLH